ncbi:MAG: hypothetical protein KC646_00140 [Candidatus Cloacimonetes bacterium]|nr:hypothetical protein [Candidatus Cloacimonadota bacterium]
MAQLNDGYYFKSSLFSVTEGEDEQTNPGIYGKSLAEWLVEGFTNCGYTNLEVIAEDWGWCIFIKEDEHSSMFIGCGSLNTDPDETLPEEIEWHVFLFSEIGLLNFKSKILNLLGKVDLHAPLQQIDKDLRMIFCDAGINLSEQ